MEKEKKQRKFDREKSTVQEGGDFSKECRTSLSEEGDVDVARIVA